MFIVQSPCFSRLRPGLLFANAVRHGLRQQTVPTVAIGSCREALSQLAVQPACAADRPGVEALLAGLPDAAAQLEQFDTAVESSLAAVATFDVCPSLTKPSHTTVMVLVPLE